MTAKSNPNEIDTLSFEQAFARLAAAVERLQSGNLSLEQAIAEFEAGQALAARCSQLLDEAQLKVGQVSVTVPMVSETAASYSVDLFSISTATSNDGAAASEGEDDWDKDIPF